MAFSQFVEPMIFDVLLAPVMAPISGISWIAGKVLEQATAEMSQENLGKRLLALQMAFDMGEIPEAEFEAQEEQLLLAIQAMEDLEKQMAAELAAE
jgi:hypothetical protein